MARINPAGATIVADSVTFEFDNGVVVKARVRVDRNWDGSVDYEISLVTNPGVFIWGMLVYLEHDLIAKGQTSYKYTYDHDDDEYCEERLIHDFEQDLFDSIMDGEYSKYYA